jgi:hypothetical protein
MVSAVSACDYSDGSTLVHHAEVCECKLAVTVLKRATTAKTKERIVVRWWRFDADDLVLRLALRTLVLCGPWHRADGMSAFDAVDGASWAAAGRPNCCAGHNKKGGH